MQTPSVATERVYISGLLFDQTGWKGAFQIGGGAQWEDLNELALSVGLRFGRIAYRLELVLKQGRVLTVWIRRGVKYLKRVLQMLRFAKSANPRARLKICVGELLKLMYRDETKILENGELGGEGLLERARFHLVALEHEKALADADRLIKQFPELEREARLVRLRAYLNKGKLRTARREIQLLSKKGVEDREAMAEYATVALHHGFRDGERVAERLLKEGHGEAIRGLGIEFSRYLADRRRYDEAKKALRTIERGTSVLDPTALKEVEAFRDEIESKEDFRKVVRSRQLLGSLRRKLWFAAVAATLALVVIWPTHKMINAFGERALHMQRLEAFGQKAYLESSVFSVEELDRGLARLRYGFTTAAGGVSFDNPLLFGSSLMLASEAKQIMQNADKYHVTYLPGEPTSSEVGPESKTRIYAYWLNTFDRMLYVKMLLGVVAGVVLVHIAGRRKS